MSRSIRMRMAHQVLKCGTQILSRTQARRNLFRDRKRAPIRQILIPHNLTISPHSVGYMDKSLLIHTTETGSSKGRQNEAATNPAASSCRVMTDETATGFHWASGRQRRECACPWLTVNPKSGRPPATFRPDITSCAGARSLRSRPGRGAPATVTMIFREHRQWPQR